MFVLANALSETFGLPYFKQEHINGLRHHVSLQLMRARIFLSEYGIEQESAPQLGVTFDEDVHVQTFQKGTT